MFSNAQKKSQRSRSRSNQKAIFNYFSVHNAPKKETKAEKAERMVREEITRLAQEELAKIEAEAKAEEEKGETVDVQHVDVVEETEQE